MLACDSKPRHNHFFPSSTSPSAHFSSSPFYDINSNSNSFLSPLTGLPFTTSTPSPSDFNGGRLSSSYFQTSAGIVDNSASGPSALTSPASTAGSQHMAGNYSNIHHQQNPAIRVEGATPTPAYPVSAGAYQAQQVAAATVPSAADFSAFWSSFGQGSTNAHRMVATGTPTLQQTSVLNRRRQSSHHSRAASNTSSNGSNSPFNQTHATSYPYVPDQSASSSSLNTAPKANQPFPVDGSRGFSNHLPTPTQTPTQDSFIAESYPPYNHQQGQILDSATITSMAMNRAGVEQGLGGDEDVPGMSHSGRHSVSSMGQEPSTPHTVAGDGFDDGFKVPTHDNIAHRQMLPKLDRTMSDVYQDELYNPATAAVAPPPMPKSMQQNSSYLSPFRNRVTDALQAAQLARSQSPLSQASRGVSPFRPDSPYVRDGVDRRMQTNGRIQAAAQSQAEQMELSHNSSPQHSSSRPTTISPKDAVIDYRPEDDDAAMASVPLFPENGQNEYGQQFARQNFAQAQFATPAQNFGNFATSGSRAGGWTDTSRAHPTQFSAGGSMPHQHQQQQTTQSPQFTFATPQTSSLTPSLTSHGLPFSAQNYRSMPTQQHEETPDFPAHLTSMESSASEAPPSSSAASNVKQDPIQQPEVSGTNGNHYGAGNFSRNGAQKPDGHATLADTGTYTCTYHGCNLRFETPQKLQKHKREGHRQVTAQQQHTPGVGSGMTSAALASRNSQAGPHKCERINPTTGKPCNTIFSRPYDLTRHEDTIHNIRKQKVRCALCVEEKTFSRNDALTRHMRVVHPDVDFPGKHRRRGAHD